jgi:hypothetical protein
MVLPTRKSLLAVKLMQWNPLAEFPPVANPSPLGLTPLPGSPFGSGGGTLAIDSTGKYLYLGTFRGIQGYNIDSATGALTLGSARLGEEGVVWLTVVRLP